MRRMKFLYLISWLVCNVALFSGCSMKDKEAGDFKYRVYGSDNTKYVCITGLTEQGKEKQLLVIPETIASVPVSALNIRGWGERSIWQSDSLKIIYLPWDMEVFKSTFYECPNLEKTFILSVEKDEVFESGSIVGSDKKFNTYIYAPHYFLDTINHPPRLAPANVTYYYNYESAPNDGCYWLDNLEEGEKITYIPQEPLREGYTFSGWYKEAECINKWDFENESIIVEDEFYENKLYAEWI